MRIVELATEPFHQTAYRTSGTAGRARDALLPWLRGRVEGWPGEGCLVLTSDLQGRVGGELLGVTVAEELALLAELGEIPPVGGIVLAGDLYDHPELAKLGTSGDVSEVWAAFAEVGPLVGVLTVGALGAATTWALGLVFMQHFESGGTLLTFDPVKVQAHYASLMRSAPTASPSGVAEAPRKP